MDPQAPVQEVRVQAGIQETSFPLGGGPATRYQRQAELQAAAGHPGHVCFMCFSGLAHADLKELSYRNVHTDSDGNTWLVGNRVKTKAPYVVKLLPIAVELIEKYRGVNEFKVSPDRVFPVGEIGSMEDSLKRIGEKAGCSVRVSPHVGRHTFATLALSKGMPLETLQKVLGHKTIISTQVYAELINPKIGEHGQDA